MKETCHALYKSATRDTSITYPRRPAHYVTVHMQHSKAHHLLPARENPFSRKRNGAFPAHDVTVQMQHSKAHRLLRAREIVCIRKQIEASYVCDHVKNTNPCSVASASLYLSHRCCHHILDGAVSAHRARPSEGAGAATCQLATSAASVSLPPM